MNEIIKLLVVEDNEADARLITEYLKETKRVNFEITWVENLTSAIHEIQQHKFNAVLTDLHLPDSQGLVTVEKIATTDPSVPLLVLTGLDDEQTGLDALNKNAQDYLVKGRLHSDLLVKSIRYAIERKKVEDILKRDKETLKKIVDEKVKELINVQLELEKAKRLSDIGTLAATVAHELRNPLAAISLAGHNIKVKAKNPNLDRHLSTIAKKVAESEQIIKNLLFYSRIKLPHYENVNLYDLIDECVETIETSCEKALFLNRNYDLIKDVTIEADMVQINEVFYNILNNACDSLSAEGGSIEISSLNIDEEVKIFVKDNGCGIDKITLSKAFDPFFTTKAKGTGLGLSVCQQIINLHGGSINIESEVEKGTVVIVTLPKKKIGCNKM